MVLLSRDATYRVRTQATLALITSRVRAMPVEVPVGPQEGLGRDSVINVDNLETIDLENLTQFVSSLSVEQMQELERAVNFALGLSN